MNPEDLYTLYRERQSDRRFADRPVPQEVLERILHNALLAPSATNQQPWSIVAVSEPEAAQRVGQAVIKGVTNMNKFALEAPVHLLIVAERGRWVARMGSRVMKVDLSPHRPRDPRGTHRPRSSGGGFRELHPRLDQRCRCAQGAWHTRQASGSSRHPHWLLRSAYPREEAQESRGGDSLEQVVTASQ